MNIMDYNLFKGLEGLEGKALFFKLATTVYWFIVGLTIFIGFFKVIEAGYQIVKKSSGGSPAYALMEHKQEIWEYIRGVIFFAIGLTIIGIIANLFANTGL